MRVLCLFASTTLSTLLLSAPARSDDVAQARFRLDPVQPASAHSPFFTVEGPVAKDLRGLDRFALSALATYARSPLTVHEERDGNQVRLGAPVENAVFAHLVASLRLSPSLSFDAAMPATVTQSGRTVVASEARVDAPSGSAVGDLRLGALWRGWLTGPWGFVAGARVWAPTGNQDAYAGDGRFRAELLAGGVARWPRSSLGCTVFASPTFVAAVHSGDRVALACAAQHRPWSAGPWLGGEGVVSALRVDPELPTGSELELWVTAHQPAGPFRMGLGAGPGLGSSPGTPAFRALATFGWVPSGDPQAPPPRPAPVLDPDLDGLVATADACPTEAGPSSPDPARSGCPKKDTDKDGIEDHLDRCPNEVGIASGDPPSHGCPDRDNDHLADAVDACPDEPGRPSDVPSASGCPARARLRGDRFEISPALTAADPSPNTPLDDAALWEVAFALRSTPRIVRVAVEVRIPAPDDEIDSAAERAITIANDLVQRLVDLGVNRTRLDPVGAIADTPGVVIRVVETSSAPSR